MFLGTPSVRRFFRTRNHIATAPAIKPSPPIDTPTATPIVVPLWDEEDDALRVVAAGSEFPAEAGDEVDASVEGGADEVLGVTLDDVVVVVLDGTMPIVVRMAGSAKGAVSKHSFEEIAQTTSNVQEKSIRLKPVLQLSAPNPALTQ